MGQLFWGFSKFSDPQVPAWRHAQLWALKIRISTIAQNHDCGGSMVLSGSPEH